MIFEYFHRIGRNFENGKLRMAKLQFFKHLLLAK